MGIVGGKTDILLIFASHPHAPRLLNTTSLNNEIAHQCCLPFWTMFTRDIECRSRGAACKAVVPDVRFQSCKIRHTNFPWPLRIPIIEILL